MTTLADDPLAQWMRKKNIPLTRDNYIDLNWGEARPDPWDAEAEAMLPDELQATSTEA